MSDKIPNNNYIETHPYTKHISKLNNYLVKKKIEEKKDTSGIDILFDNKLIKEYFDIDIKNETTGGVLYKDVTVDPSTPAKQLSEYEFDFDSDKTFDKNNVLILGGGPVGLAMAILLKLYIPELDVKVIEKRGTNNKRKLDRQQLITLTTYYFYDHDDKKNEEKRTLLESLFNELKIGEPIKSLQIEEHTFFAFPNEYITGKDKLDTLPISINTIEYFLSKKATELGVLIINSDINKKEDLKKLTTDKTLVIFDATGGRLQFNMPDWTEKNPPTRYCSCIMGDKKLFDPKKNIQSLGISQDNYYLSNENDFYLCKCKKDKSDSDIKVEDYIDKKDISKITTSNFEFKVKGYNQNHTNIINGVPLISIGDSMRSADFTSGSGTQFGLSHNLLCALMFKRYYESISQFSINKNIDTTPSVSTTETAQIKLANLTIPILNIEGMDQINKLSSLLYDRLELLKKIIKPEFPIVE